MSTHIRHYLVYVIFTRSDGPKIPVYETACTKQDVYRVSQEECARLRENVPYVKARRCNPKHLYPKLNGYGDNGERSLKV
jgi:hypothetical protein